MRRSSISKIDLLYTPVLDLGTRFPIAPPTITSPILSTGHETYDATISNDTRTFIATEVPNDGTSILPIHLFDYEACDVINETRASINEVSVGSVDQEINQINLSLTTSFDIVQTSIDMVVISSDTTSSDNTSTQQEEVDKSPNEQSNQKSSWLTWLNVGLVAAGVSLIRNLLTGGPQQDLDNAGNNNPGAHLPHHNPYPLLLTNTDREHGAPHPLIPPFFFGSGSGGVSGGNGLTFPIPIPYYHPSPPQLLLTDRPPIIEVDPQIVEVEELIPENVVVEVVVDENEIPTTSDDNQTPTLPHTPTHTPIGSPHGPSPNVDTPEEDSTSDEDSDDNADGNSVVMAENIGGNLSDGETHHASDQAIAQSQIQPQHTTTNILFNVYHPDTSHHMAQFNPQTHEVQLFHDNQPMLTQPLHIEGEFIFPPDHQHYGEWLDSHALWNAIGTQYGGLTSLLPAPSLGQQVVSQDDYHQRGLSIV